MLSRVRGRNLIGPAWLVVAVAFTAWALLPELQSRTPELNDHVFHGMNLQRAAEAFEQGKDPTDVWIPWVGQGYPVFHYYQHLPYVLPAGLSVFADIDLLAVFGVLNYLLLCLFPVSVYWSVRRLGFSSITAGTSALVAPLLSTDALFGLDFASYVWAGHGLYTQLWGMVLLPPAVAQSYRAIRDGGGYASSALLITATALSHLAYGYIAVGSLIAFLLLVPRWRSLAVGARRAALIVGTFVIAASYFLLPLVADREYLNRSVWEIDEKYDSFGAPAVLGWLVRGELLDFGRLPSITLLAAVGIGFAIWHWRTVRLRVPVLLFVLWLVMYFGRPVWGFLLDRLPLFGDFYFHRLIGGVHLAAIMLAGIGLAGPLLWAIRCRSPGRFVAVCAAGALLLAPAVGERVGYAQLNRSLMERTDAAMAAEAHDLDRLFTALAQLPEGRVYAGLAGQWGGDYTVGDVPMYALLAAQGYDTLRLYHSWSLPGDMAAAFDEQRLDQYDLFNVRYVVAPETRELGSFAEPMGAFGRHVLYGVQTSGYFGLVDAPVAFTADKREFFGLAFRWLGSGQVATAAHPLVYLEDPPGESSVPLLAAAESDAYFESWRAERKESSSGAISAESISNDAFKATVRVGRESLLMVRATFHPNWHASVDGREVDVQMVLPGYIAVPVEPGSHRVTVEYRAAEWRPILLTLGIIVLAMVAVFERRRAQVTSTVGRIVSRIPRPDRQDRASPPTDPSNGGVRVTTSALGWLTAIAVAAVTIRIVLLPQYAYLPGEALDGYAWSRWMAAIQEHGILNVFRETRTDYVAYHWVLGGLSWIYEALGGVYVEYPPRPGQYAAFPLGLHLLMKAPGIVFDLLLIGASYAVTLTVAREVATQVRSLRGRERRLALGAALAVALHPVVWYDSAVWGQIDAAGAAAMLGSVALIARNRPGWGWACWTLGFLVKPQSFLILPVLLVLTWRSGRWNAAARGLGSVSAVAIVVLAPWLLHGELGRIVEIYARNFQGGLYSGAASLSAWNGWWLSGLGSLQGAADTSIAGLDFLTPRSLGLVLAAAAAVIAAFHAVAWPSLVGALVSGGYLAFAFFMLPTGVHERYLYPFVVLMLPLAIVGPRWRWMYTAVSATLLLNLLAVGPPIHDLSGGWHQSSLSYAVAGANVALFAWFTWRLVRPIKEWLSRVLPDSPWHAALERTQAAIGWDLPAQSPLAANTDSAPRGAVGAATANARTLGDLWGIGLTAGGSLLAGFPLVSGRMMSGHDSLVYVPRSIEFHEVLRAGVWLPRWAPHLGHGHGEPIFNFNPPLINYLASALQFGNLDFVAAENAASLLLLALSGFGMYVLAREFFGWRGGAASAVAYVFAPYLLSRLYVSHALADYAAFAFIPFAFWAVYRYALWGQSRFLLLSAAAVCLIILSSLPAAAMTIPSLVAMVLWLWLRGGRSGRLLLRGAWCLVLGLGLSASFWLPSLAETGFVHIDRRVERLNYRDHFVSPLQLLHSPWGFGTSRAGADDGMSFGIGPAHLAALVVAGAILVRRRPLDVSPRARHAVAAALVLAGVAAFMTTSLARPVWDALAVLHPLQFPFRFLQLVAFASAFLVGSTLTIVPSRARIANAALAAILAAIVALGVAQARPEGYLELGEDDFTPTDIAARGIAASAREFEPIWVEEFPTDPVIEPRLTFVSGSGRVIDSLFQPTQQLFSVDVMTDVLVQSSTFYFPGWTLYVDGSLRAVAPGTPHGLMEFYLEPGRHAVLLRFEDTSIRIIGGVASVLALALLIVFMARPLLTRFTRTPDPDP